MRFSFFARVPAINLDQDLDVAAGALSNSLARKMELLHPTESGSRKVHGFLTDQEATSLLLSVRPNVGGLYILYLEANHPDAIRLAYTVDGHGSITYRTIYRYNRGYTCRPVVSHLSRYAAWRVWCKMSQSQQGAAALSLGAAAKELVDAARDLFYLWRCEDVDAISSSDNVELEGSREILTNRDPWHGIYPTLRFFTTAMRNFLKVGLNPYI